MMTEETKITKHTFSLPEVLAMVINRLHKKGVSPIPVDFVEIRARRGTASILLDTLEVKYRETEKKDADRMEATDEGHRGTNSH